jgi:hypothetical protein
LTAGFQAFTDTGLFQIDGLTPNFQLTASLAQVLQQEILPTVYNNVGTQFYATYWHTTFTFTAATPFFAFVADGNVMVTPWKFTQTGASTYQAEFIGASQTTVRLFIFDQVAPTSSHFGLQVFDASGRLIADAASPFARVIDVQSGQYVPGTGYDATGSSMPGTGTLIMNYGSRPVAIAGCFPAHYMFNTGDGSGGETTMTGIAVSGGQVTWELHTFNGTRGSHFIGYREASYYRFMVLDMTGIL